jgi:hypothetical protein
MATITLRQWCEAGIEQRSAWLEDGSELDERSRKVMLWVNAFRKHGAVISDKAMLAVYDSF